MISVIVPVYNVESCLDRCILSVIEQTYSDLEIILVDDGSTDRSPEICDKWKTKDSRVVVLHKKNGGLSDARNAGLSVAKGEYISFVDSDDYIAGEMLEKLLYSLRLNHCDIAACTVLMIFEDGRPDKLLTVQKNLLLDKNQAQEALLRETTLKQPVWYKLYRREIINGIRFETGKWHEDVFWSYQVIGNAEKVSIIDYIGYYYVQRAGSIMNSQYSLKRLDVIEAYEKRYQYISENFPELEKKARIRVLANCIFHGQMTLKYIKKSEKKKAFSYLKSVAARYPFRKEDFKEEKLTHSMWYILAGLSLEMTCSLKNLMRTGL